MHRAPACGICDQRGHYSPTCPTLVVPDADELSSQPSRGPLRRCHHGCGALLWRDQTDHECPREADPRHSNLDAWEAAPE